VDSNAIITILREGLFLVLLLSAAPMLASVVIGLTISMFQAVTQLQEPTLSYVPKVVGVLITIAILGPWIMMQTVRFARTLFDSIALIR
jgi:flagellar biosynthesis protein FliQ